MPQQDDRHRKAPVVFVHSMGRGGADAWPVQAGVEWDRSVVFLTRRGWGSNNPILDSYTFRNEADWMATQLDEPSHIVGHSWSGVVALQLALLRPDIVRSLILCEPATLSLATDDSSVRDHITAMRHAYEPRISVEEFGRRFAMGWGGSDEPDTWTAERRLQVLRLQRHQAPWTAGIDRASLNRLHVPVLVVSSGAIDFFEVVARRLGAHPNVTWREVGGPAHRPQDDVTFNATAADWLRTHDLQG